MTHFTQNTNSENNTTLTPRLRPVLVLSSDFPPVLTLSPSDESSDNTSDYEGCKPADFSRGNHRRDNYDGRRPFGGSGMACC